MSSQLNKRETEILALLSAGRTDQQIADELFLSLNTIKWYNRQIYSKLGLSNRVQATVYATEHGLLDKDAPPQLPLPAASAMLPTPSTRFIGRSRETAEVKQKLRHARLLTLTGAGGAGKTRLALRVATELAEQFADGLFFVDLAPLSDHGLVLETIARSLGVLENPNEALLETLKRALAGREMLLLVDNFEHVIAGALFLPELLAASPQLKLLVTSRQPLHVSGEHEYHVPPLSLPRPGAISPQQLLESEAGSLFVQRAQMSLRHFKATEDNAAAIAQICLRLDGIPLALELAAARCKLLPPQALLDQLTAPDEGSPFRALAAGARDAPPRQQTMWRSIEWSYNLLHEDEKRLFTRLAVFRGGRSLEAIGAICGEGLSVDLLDALASLVDHSLVQQKEAAGGEPRFVLLELIHQFARERLEAGSEAEKLRQAHAYYFVNLVERAEPELRLARYDEWCDKFELERDNIRAVLEWSLSGGDIVAGVRLAAALSQFWYGKGHHAEGIRWMQQLLERIDEAPVVYHARFFIGAGHMAWLNDLALAQRHFRRALETSREIGDKRQMAWALTSLAYALQQEPESALPVAEEALALFREQNHLPGIAQTFNIIGEVARIHGDDERARRAYEACLAVSRQTGEARRIGYMLSNLTYIAQHEDDHQQALALARQSLQLARERKSRYDAAWSIELIAGSIGALGNDSGAARLLGASAAIMERMGSLHQPTDEPEYKRIMDDIHASLNPATFQEAWDEGRQMTLDQATLYALKEAAVLDNK